MLQQECRDCHSGILNDNADQAEDQNIPGIEKCRSCHNSQGVSSRCVTCHAFHPDKDRRLNLLKSSEKQGP